MKKNSRLEIEWYEKGGGKNFIKRYIYQQYMWIEKNYFKMPNSDAQNCGVYGICFNDRCVYIGESSEIACRWLAHIYHMCVNSRDYWGLDIQEIETATVNIKMQVIDDGLVDEEQRRYLEFKYIDKYNPILQLRIDKYYPNDKAEYDKVRNIWLPRDEVRPDQCVIKKYRREVIEKSIIKSGI
ncbi:hypothetical protein [Clostridium guangxiense]|uniref:hypothetical protein n=1 Tax=Clostridium guangxiense TaxID=1662055 RepID=UPI001E6452B4|nr:hypothetical protein [Clostridium guangxiense]MCD2347178.1 hypothetical protein [Clostridium guangxiense]